MDEVIIGFRPVVDERTRVLVLGSMPSEESLRRGEYYAHARNRFWPMIQDVLGIPLELPYQDRLSALKHHGIGLWDVIESCERVGSLDSRIVSKSEMYNGLSELFERFPGISVICCNGAKAHDSFLRKVSPGIPKPMFDTLSIFRLPSTSPANASYRYEDIVKAWSDVLARDGDTNS